MSGGRLVVLDRAGRDIKRYSLPSGLVTLGSDPSCDIRVLLPSVCGHHASVVVRANQTIVRNVADGVTLLNGEPVSVAALGHGDRITLGDRSLRWEYDAPAAARRAPAKPAAALYVNKKRAARGRGRASDSQPRRLDPAVRYMMEVRHRASMPGNVAGSAKQVAIVQPQRRDAGETPDTNPRLVVKPHRPYSQPAPKRQRSSRGEPSHDDDDAAAAAAAHTPDLTTKASQWIESRKASPRRTPVQSRTTPKRAATAKKATPLRTVVLRKAITPNMKFSMQKRTPRVGKIQDPLTVDHTKQAALLLMTGHTKPATAAASAAALTAASAASSAAANAAAAAAVAAIAAGPRGARASVRVTAGRGRRSRGSGGETSSSASVLEISDTDSGRSRRAGASSLLPSPRKSALKDPSAKHARKTESIKFDLSNLDGYRSDSVVYDSDSVSDSTHHYSDSSAVSPSRSTRMLESVGARSPKKYSSVRNDTLTPQSPSSRKSSRGSMLVNRALESPGDSSKANLTKTLSPRSRKTQSYSIVDLVSGDDQSTSSVYDSVASTNTTFGTPRTGERKTRSIIETAFVDSSTPYVKPKTRRSKGSDVSDVSSQSKSISSATSSVKGSKRSNSLTALRESKVHTPVRRSASLTKPPSLTKRNRSSQNDSDVLFVRESDSPRSTKASKLSQSRNSTVTEKSVQNISDLSPNRKSRLLNRSQNYISVVSSPARTSLSNASQNTTYLSEESSPVIDGVIESPKSTRKSKKSLNSTQRSRKSRRSLNPSTVSRNSTRLSITPSPRSARGSKRSLDATADDSLPIALDIASPILNASKRQSKALSSGSPRLSAHSARTSLRKTNSPSILAAAPPSPKRSSRSNASPEIRMTKTPSPRIRSSTAKSPRNSKNSPVLIVSKSFNKSPKRDSVRKSSRSTGNSPSSESGLHTPENETPPQDVGTPMLSMQSILDSSYTVPKRNSKRKTVAAQSAVKPRKGTRSKSLLLPRNRNASNSPNQSVRASAKLDKTVTPRSTIKLVQQAVKEKHSTAKKPVSKRSIIDDLNDSDIVKQLFNSPVKRKLSQSMTEFSRRFLDEELPTKRGRKTIAIEESPSNFILERTQAYTPERFVSPLNTPTATPSASAKKASKSPRNDLTDVRGVKALLKTPRARKSVKNDLTNVSGVKKVFAKSPNNNLSHVRGVKEVFRASPANDLRRVSGVKSLFRNEEQHPKNDLTDVRGVKRLYQRSPKNDLRRVSGVKKTVNRRSPKNDLSDVRGVKRLFNREKSRDALADLSGVEELFDTSFDSHKNSRDNSRTEDPFDQLVGKQRQVKAYAKSFSRPQSKAVNKRTAKSLNASIDKITTNVEEWLEQELQKRVQNVPVPASYSRNVTRELQNLATDTVAGTAPLQTSRVRNSTASNKSVSRSKSASERYSLHTLPIKKRSIEGSLYKSLNKSKAKLPIKKRALVHSTPVKGRVNVTANASELGRVSPIVAEKTTAAAETTVKPPASPMTKPPKAKNPTPAKSLKTKAQPKSRRGADKSEVATSPVANKSTRRAKAAVIPKAATPKPKRGAKTKAVADEAKSPPKRNTRAKPKTPTKAKADKQEVNNTKKRRASLVITKKTPVMSPKATRRGKIVEASGTPKATRAKKTKEAPQNARGGRSKKADVEPKKVEEAPKNAKGRSKKAANTSKKDESKAKSTSKAADVPTKRGKATSKKAKPSPKKAESPKKADKPKARSTRGKDKSVEAPPPSPPKRRQTRAKVVDKPATPKSRRQKAVVIAKPSPQLKPESPKKGKTQAAAAAPPPASRKRKAEPTPEVPVVETRRGRKTVTVTTEIKTVSAKQKRSTVKNSKVEISLSTTDGGTTVKRTSRAKKVVEVTERGRRTEEAVSKKDKSVEAKPAPKGRKRKTEVSPAKAPAKKGSAEKQPRRAAEAASPARRATRQRPAPASPVAPRRRR